MTDSKKTKKRKNDVPAKELQKPVSATFVLMIMVIAIGIGAYVASLFTKEDVAPSMAQKPAAEGQMLKGSDIADELPTSEPYVADDSTIVTDNVTNSTESTFVTESVTIPESPSYRYTLDPNGDILYNYYGDYIEIPTQLTNGYVIVTWEESEDYGIPGVLNALLVYIKNGEVISYTPEEVNEIGRTAIFKIGTLKTGTYGVFLALDDYSVMSQMDLYLLKEDEYANLKNAYDNQNLDTTEDIASYRPFGDFVREELTTKTHMDAYSIDWATTQKNLVKNISQSANKGLLYGLTG